MQILCEVCLIVFTNFNPGKTFGNCINFFCTSFYFSSGVTIVSGPFCGKHFAGGGGGLDSIHGGSMEGGFQERSWDGGSSPPGETLSTR